ncbi:hypothetical protein ABVN80_21710 [Acinetobacter baumannii]
MERIAKPLRLIGVRIIQATGRRYTTCKHYWWSTIKGIQYALPMASAQVKSWYFT